MNRGFMKFRGRSMCLLFSVMPSDPVVWLSGGVCSLILETVQLQIMNHTSGQIFPILFKMEKCYWG